MKYKYYEPVKPIITKKGKWGTKRSPWDQRSKVDKNENCGLWVEQPSVDFPGPSLDTNEEIALYVASNGHEAVVVSSGRLFMRGSNLFGQVGIDESSFLEEDWMLVLDGVESVRLGKYFTIVLLRDGRLMACGCNEYGQLATGNITHAYSFREISYPFESEIQTISCGENHSVCLDSDGVAHGWGRSVEGQVGILCRFLKEDGKLKELIKSRKDEQGDNQTNKSFQYQDDKRAYLSKQLVPRAIKAIEQCGKERPFIKFTDIACGQNFTALLSHDYRLYFCGESRTGVSAQGNNVKHIFRPIEAQFSEPLRDQTTEGVRVVNVTLDYEPIPDEKPPSFYREDSDEEEKDLDPMEEEVRIKLSFSMEKRNVNVEPEHLNDRDILKISVGWNHVLVLCRNGELYSCGLNTHQQCGLGPKYTKCQSVAKLTRVLLPKSVTFADQIAEIGTGKFYSCFITKRGRLYAWGLIPGHSTCVSLPTRLVMHGFVEKIFCGADRLLIGEQT